MSRYMLAVVAMLVIAIARLPSALAATRLDLTVSGLWIQSLAYSAIPLSGTAGSGFALDLYPWTALSLELGAALPSHIGIATELGSVRLSAYTLTAKYHFLPHSRFSPYLGVGAYHSLQSFDSKYSILGVASSSTGGVVQAGLNCRIGSHWFANLDVRYLGSVGSNEVVLTSLKIPLSINPIIIGLGIGYRVN